MALALYNKKSGKGSSLLSKLKNLLFFAEILTIGIEGFIELYISGYLQVKTPYDTTVGEVYGAKLGYFLLALGCVFVPGAIIWTMVQSNEILEDNPFQTMWGPCYNGIRLQDNWTRAFYFIYILRRFIFISIGFFVEQPVF